MKKRSVRSVGHNGTEKFLLKIGVYAALAIAAIVLIVLFLGKFNTATGNWVYAGNFIQYEPKEVCRLNGCLSTNAFEHDFVKTPLNSPRVACLCDGRVEYLPLIQRVY